MKIPVVGRLKQADEAACTRIMQALEQGMGRKGIALWCVLAAAVCALCAATLGGCGMYESMLMGAIALIWGQALLRGKELGVFQVLCALCVMVLIYGARMCLLPAISPDCEDYLLVWADVMENLSFGEIMTRQVGDYTVIYQYIVYLISRIPLDRVVMYKALSIAFEALLAWSVASLACHVRACGRDSAIYRTAFIVTLCLPTVLLNSALWAQCDAIYTALALAGVVLTLEKRTCLASVCFALSLSFKLQAVFLLPVIVVLLAMRRLSLRHVLLMGGVFALVALPAAICGKGVKGVLLVYLYQMKKYKDLTLSAPSLYAAFENLSALGSESASRVGILLAMAACVAVVGIGVMTVMGRDKALTMQRESMFISDVIFALAIGVPLFLPYMHERYFFAADVMSVIYVLRHRRGVPVAAGVVLASLNGYCDYLFKTKIFPMKLGAAFMAAAFVCAMLSLHANLSMRGNRRGMGLEDMK